MTSMFSTILPYYNMSTMLKCQLLSNLPNEVCAVVFSHDHDAHITVIQP